VRDLSLRVPRSRSPWIQGSQVTGEISRKCNARVCDNGAIVSFELVSFRIWLEFGRSVGLLGGRKAATHVRPMAIQPTERRRDRERGGRVSTKRSFRYDNIVRERKHNEIPVDLPLFAHGLGKYGKLSRAPGLH